MEELNSLPGWASSFDDLLDQRVLVLLIDGRKIVGTLRSYDQFANILIDNAYERHVADSLFADVFLGVMIIRGENMALFGEVVDSDLMAEVPLDVLLVRKAEEIADQHGGKGISVDLGFLDDM